MRKLPILLGIAALAAAASAQTLVIPQGMDTSNPGSTTLAWRNVAFRFQMLYDQDHFLAQGINYPITITRLQYRASGGATSPGGETYSGLTVQMSSSPNDWSSASTTFANNTGTDNVTVYTGNITCLPAAGSSPNTYIIDIPLQTPFNYDPTAGLDLLIDVDSPMAPIPATMPAMAAASNAGHLARRISTTTVGSPTGSLSYFACVVLMDFAPVPNAATATKIGDGCVASAQSFYEVFAAGVFDLQGTAGSPNSILLTPTGSGYAVSQGSNGWFTPTSADLALGDDALSAALTLPFTFNYPGGSTNDILICSNGFVWLDTTQTAASASGNPSLLLTQGVRLAPLWHDMNPAAGGTVHFDVDPSNNTVYATWLQVPLWATPTNFNTLQVAMYSDGRVEYRWQDCANDDAIVGWSPGGGARDAGNLDISASLPFLTGPDVYPLVLEPITRPKLGGNLMLEVRDIPAGVTLGATNFGFLQYTTPIDLAPLGMPTCFQYASLDVGINVAPTGSTEPIALIVPNDPNLVGAHMYLWSVMVSPGSNALGVITSNAVDLLFDVN